MYFGVNEHACIRHLKRAGILERTQRRRRFASESLAPSDRGFVLIEKSLLIHPKLLAFVVSVLISPEPMRPIKAAQRIGISSEVTARKLARKAIESGHVTKGVGCKGESSLAGPAHSTR